MTDTPTEPEASPPTSTRPPHVRGTVWRVLQVPVKVIAAVWFRLEAHGVDRVPPTGGVLLVSNHQSYLDPPLLGAPLTRAVAFLAKSELFRFGPFAWLIRSLNAFPVKQGAGDVGAMKESIRLLKAGWMLNVFPEGSRTPDGQLHKSQKGVVLLIRKAGVPVQPAVIDGSYRAWPRGSMFVRPRKIHILYGEPVDLAGKSPDEILAWIDTTFRTMLDDLRAGRIR